MSALLVTCFTLVSCLAYSSTLKLEVTRSFETWVDFKRTTWRYISEDRSLHYIVRAIKIYTVYSKIDYLCAFFVGDGVQRPEIYIIIYLH
jgi:hypothetical protein